MSTTREDSPVQIRLHYGDLNSFIEKFSPNVTRGGIFLATRDLRPVGEIVRFEVLLMTGAVILSGEGRVTWVKEFNPALPNRAYGMGVQFLFVDPDARPVLDRLLKKKEPVRRATPNPAAAPVAADAPIPERRRPPAESFNDFDDGIDETSIRRAADRARLLAARTDDVESLLAPDNDEPLTLDQALAELPRLLAGNRRNTGLFRVVPAEGSGPLAIPSTPDNGETPSSS